MSEALRLLQREVEQALKRLQRATQPSTAEAQARALEEFAKKMRAESAEQARMAELLHDATANNEAHRLRARIAELEAERAELVKDRERLDWLETADNGGYHCDILWHAIDSGTLEPDQEQELPTLRQAIDAAREGE